MSFPGIPHAAAAFYADLEQDNSREFWARRRDDYQQHVRGPMETLLAELEPDFGPAKVFRPHRDVRFAADKSPYKTHQGGFVPVAEATGWYAEVSADGFRLGGGTYRMEPPALAAYRAAVDDEELGTGLERIVTGLRADGWQIGGETLRTAPRGWPREHGRIELLRHRALTALRWVDDVDVVTSARLVEEVRDGWEQLRPLVTWLARAVAEDASR